jgi:hypothetical protein
MDPAAIADNRVESATDKKEYAFRELWSDQTCVIVFFRRFATYTVRHCKTVYKSFLFHFPGLVL